MSTPTISTDELTVWSRYIHSICGIELDSSKGYLIETRMASLLRETNSGGWSELLYKVKNETGTALRTKVISAITTNETSFFRDTAPFELLQFKILPELIDRKTKSAYRPIPIRILSAACSTGQEAYSTAIVLKELLGDFTGYDIRILGLDISDAAIAQASYGHFSRMELERGLNADKITRYFEPVGDKWKIIDPLRALVTFRRANLLEPLTDSIPFDLIFCRNVAIYFNESDKIKLFKNMERSLDRNGALIIGSTESLTGLCPDFEAKRYQRSVFYQKKV